MTAKLLNLDDKVGSLKVGKDADIVIWDGHLVKAINIQGTIHSKEKSDLIKQMFAENPQGRSIFTPNST